MPTRSTSASSTPTPSPPPARSAINGGSVEVNANVSATGEAGAVTIEATAGNVEVGGEMPETPRLSDLVRIEAETISLSAPNGEVIVGPTAVLRTPDLGLEAAGTVTVRVQLVTDGDLEINATAPLLVLDQVEVLNGNITVNASADLEARKIVLLNDWNHNPESDPEGDGLDEIFGTPNVIHLTAGGEITVGTITGGLYARMPPKPPRSGSA